MLVSKARTAGAVAVVAVSAMAGFGIYAAGEEGGGGDAPPGLPYREADGAVPAAQQREITIGGTTFDPTILTKFIPGTGFVVRQGEGIENDRTNHLFGGTCVSASSGSGGVVSEYRAGVELPDGARIKRVVFFGEDNDATRDILIRLNRTTVTPPPVVPGPTTRTDQTIASFTSEGVAGVVVVSSPDLTELAGSVPSGVATGVEHRFHDVYVELRNSSLSNHRLCGVEIEYQVPMSAAAAGTVFHPIDPVRAFDSRLGAYAGSGILAPNTSRTIPVRDGHDLVGAVTVPDVVPVGATAVAYNITVTGQTGPNFVSVTPGDAAGFNTAAVNFGATGELGNAGVVSIDAQRRIKVWGGGNTGSTHFVIDITGFFAPAPPIPNMGN